MLRIVKFSPIVCLALLLTGGVVKESRAQVAGSTRTSPAYLAAFNALYDGEYKTALRAFQGTRGMSSTQGRWIDSICHYAMTGECYYRMGNYTEALENYDAALRIYIEYSDWMIKVQFPPVIQPTNAVRPSPWGASKRGAIPGRFPETMPIAIGTLNVEEKLRSGGVITPPSLHPIQVQEIVRCVCLSMMRRRELLGPLAVYDPLTDQLINTAARRQGHPNHWSEAWLDALQGFAYSAGDKGGQAVAHLKQSLLVQGQYDHPITPITFLELGRMSMDSGDLKAAAGFFEEATYSAFQFGDMNVLEEAFRGLHLATLVMGDTSVLDQPLSAAIGWSKTRARELNASLLLMAAESMALRGKTQQATGLLNDAKASMGRRDMAACAIGSRYFYLTALTSYQRGAVAPGDEAFAAAMRWQRESAVWLFQIGLADMLCTTNPGGRYSARAALELYEKLLRDPGPTDWSLRPLESLTVLMTPHPLPFEHWFEATLSRQSFDAALEVADRAKRHRFLATLPMGGRLNALRWVLEAPEESLDNRAKLQRQELLGRFPKYAEAARKVKLIQAELAAAGIQVDPAAQREQAAKLGELAALSAGQEVILREMAIRRAAADMVFPPVRATKDVQAALAPGQLLLSFFCTSRSTYGWLYANNNYAFWKIENPTLLEKRITVFLRSLGNFDGNQELQQKQLTDQNWKQAANDVLQTLLQNSKVTFNANFQELVIVPDGVLWYLPFEALPGGDPGEYRPLLTHCRLRYAPTVGLAIPQRQGRQPTPHIGVALGKLHPADAPTVAEAAAEELGRAIQHAVPLQGPSAVQSPLWGTTVDGLIVLDDLETTRGPYDWLPLPLDRNKSAGTLNVWMSLPWKRVDQFILPGFHTAAESGISKNVPTPPGNELFLATTGLMSTGARTILLSRWRTGGQAAIDLVREFAQELPYVAADEAWQRAVQLVSQAPLDPQLEPRVKRSPDSTPLKAEHPFFWAGYMLVDSGALPQKIEKPVEPPVLRFEGKNPAPMAPPAAPEAKPEEPAGPPEANPAPGSVEPQPMTGDMPGDTKTPEAME